MNAEIKGIIFDMDGVISDTQKLHARVESELLARLGVIISPEEITRQYAGVNTRKFLDEILRNQSVPYDLDGLMEEKWAQIEALAAQSVDPINGSIELIKRLHGAGFKKAVASASNLNYVERVIQSLGLEEYFEFLAGGDMVTNGKPDPEIFLLAASKIGIDPIHCLVIEDGTSGMKAAKSANMKCIGLVESKEREYPTENLVLSLNEVTLEYLNNLS